MKDYLIKLSDAIAALGEKPLAWVGAEYELGLQKQWQSDINALKRLPPAPRWTLCSKPFIIPDHEVLCCDRRGNELIGWLFYSNGWICESEGEIMNDPIAWMPLPEPYKTEKEVEE